MFDIQFAVSVCICAIGIGLFLGMVIVLICNQTNGYDFTSSYNRGYIITAIIGLVIFTISLFFVVKYYKLFNSLDVVYKRLLNDLNKADKELQKFYIDHPEFKENKE